MQTGSAAAAPYRSRVVVTVGEPQLTCCRHSPVHPVMPVGFPGVPPRERDAAVGRSPAGKNTGAASLANATFVPLDRSDDMFGHTYVVWHSGSHVPWHAIGGCVICNPVWPTATQ